MTVDPVPEWLRQTPNLPSIHDLPNVPWGGYNPQNAQLPSLPDLAQFIGKFIEKFLGEVVLALAGLLIPGLPSFDQLKDWADNLPNQIAAFIESLNIFAIPAEVQSSINAALGDLQDALHGSYTGSGPIFLAVQALAEAWLKATDPLNAANLFGRIALPQFGSGVPIMALTTAVPNELEPFTATSVPSEDGWSFNAGQDAAQVVCDGSPKALYLKSGVIKVEEGQPLDTSIDVTYSGVTSGAGQTIRYVLETFTTDDGSGSATPVTVGAVTSPSGTITTPVTLGDSSWDIPAGVKSVRPVLEGDELITAGTVFWHNTPELFKKLAGPLADGLPKAIQDRIDDLQATWDRFKGGVGGTVDDIEDALNDAGQAIRDALAQALGHAGTGHTSANLLTYFQNIPKNVVDGLEDFWDAITGKTVNLTAGGLFDAGKLSNVTGTISQSLVTGLTGSLGDLQTTLNQIGDIFDNTVVTPINGVVQAIKDWWNQWFGGGSTNAIPLSQKGVANGVATLDSTGNVPLSQLGNAPASGGDPNDHILFTLPANQSIPNGTATSLAGWQQVGSVSATFDDGTNTRFTLPKAGWWDIQSQVVWASSATGKRQSAVVRTLTSGSAIPATSGEDAADHPAWPVRNKIRDTQEVASRGSLAATDKFSIQVYQNSGAALDAVSGYPDGTYVLATYLGERKFEAFSEENVNRTNQPVPDGVAGCWVTLGGGSGGGGGGQKNTPAAYGGGGGGGGAKIFRTWIPVSLLGSTYSVTRGTFGLPGTGGTTGNGGTGGSGGASTFTSGSVSMSAGGGAGGTGGSTSATVPGGAGGTASVSGTTATTAAGTAGGGGGSSTSAGVNNTAGGGAGGGGGGSSSGSASPGKGGDSTAAAGTAAAAANQTGANPAAGGGGGNSAGIAAGRNGGNGCGAGGGGGGAGGTSFGADGGDGGRGYTLIEWV
ncbi:glycine-rich domain-containing protein [Mycolicibacterium sp. XJ775]